jgi:hypothetical protein
VAAISIEDATTLKLKEISKSINDLPIDVFQNESMADTLTSKINSILLKIDELGFRGAYNQLQNDVLKKTDGCANYGSPENNDWIKDCESQDLVYPIIMEALELLSELLE